MWRLTGQGLIVATALIAFVFIAAWVAQGAGVTSDILGALVGAAGTIFAGWVAWAAIQRQIAESRRREDQARAAVRAEMGDLVADINCVWELVDLALGAHSNKAKWDDLQAHAMATLGILLHSVRIDDLAEARGALGPLDGLRYREVVRQVRRILEAAERDGFDGNIYWRLVNLRTQFSHFERYLRAFDIQLAERFVRRRKSNVDHRPQAEHLAPYLENARKRAAQPD